MTITHDYEDDPWDSFSKRKKRKDRPRTVEDGFEEGCVED